MFKDLKEARAALKAKKAEAKALRENAVNEKGEARNFTDAERETLRGLKSGLDEIVKAIEVFEIEEQMENAAAEPADEEPDEEKGENETGGRARVPARAKQPALDPMKKIGVVCHALVRGHREKRNALDVLDDMGHGGIAKASRLHDERLKALNITVEAEGGVTVPEITRNEVIELLRPQSRFIASEPRVVQLSGGTLEMPRQATGSSAAYVGENVAIGSTEPIFNKVSLVARKLAAIVPVTNELMSDSLIDMEGFVRSDLSEAVGTTFDANAYRGASGGSNPVGIYNLVPATHRIAVGAGATYSLVLTELGKMLTQLDKANVPRIRPRWSMNPRTKTFLMTLLNGQGIIAFPSLEGPNPTLFGYPVMDSTNLPANLGGGGNESEIGLFDFADVIFAPRDGLTFAVTNEAVVNGVSAFENDLTFIRAITRHDVSMRRVVSGVVLTGVTWAAGS